MLEVNNQCPSLFHHTSRNMALKRTNLMGHIFVRLANRFSLWPLECQIHFHKGTCMHTSLFPFLKGDINGPCLAHSSCKDMHER